jgi:hypothetical protein
MAKSYSGNNKVRKIITPILDKTRAKYRGVRSSEQEATEANQFLLDINRVSTSLSQLSSSIDPAVEQLTGTTSIYNNFSIENLQEIFRNDGVVNPVENLMVYIDSDEKDYSDENDQDELYLSTILRNQGRLSRLISRINTLEKGKTNG